MPTPTTEQAHIIDRALNSPRPIMITAYAGTGKTTTLEMIQSAIPVRPCLYLAFGHRNAKEATGKMLSTTTIRTFNGFGHRVWANACAKNLSLSPRKTQDTLREIINEVRKADQGPLWDAYHEVVAGVARAKALGYIPEGHIKANKSLIKQSAFHARLEETPDDLVSDLIDAVLTRSIASAYKGLIDFNDQIYMPALFGGTYPQFPVVLVDEYQDLNPTNHAMIAKMTKSRLIAVGDEAQSIYAFRGAQAGGMANAIETYAMEPADLSVSFRCPQAIVEHAKWRVPNFKWSKSGGSVEQPTKLELGDIPDSAAIICRNNAPLLRAGLQLLATGRSISIAGSDIGPRLVGIMRKLGSTDLTRESTLAAVDDWLEDKLAKDSTTATDLADCMKVFAKAGANLGQAIGYAEHVFKQDGKLLLTSGHKAKGLEWDTVIHLDPDLCRNDEQDRNLRYVIQTRSAHRLIEVNSDAIQW